LPDDVRSKVIEEHRWINVDYDWWESLIDEFIHDMQKAYGVVLEKEKIEFDLDRGGHVKYNGSFWMNVEACKDKVRTLREIYSLIATAAMLEPELAQQVKESIDDMEVGYERGNLSITWSDVYGEDENKMDPFDALAHILNDDHCTSLPDELEGELKGLIDDEFQKLLNQLRSEYEYLTSDECVVETLNANGYLFTEAGQWIPRVGL